MKTKISEKTMKSIVNFLDYAHIIANDKMAECQQALQDITDRVEFNNKMDNLYQAANALFDIDDIMMDYTYLTTANNPKDCIYDFSKDKAVVIRFFGNIRDLIDSNIEDGFPILYGDCESERHCFSVGENLLSGSYSNYDEFKKELEELDRNAKKAFELNDFMTNFEKIYNDIFDM